MIVLDRTRLTARSGISTFVQKPGAQINLESARKQLLSRFADPLISLRRESIHK
jgi:hypothetical protein